MKTIEVRFTPQQVNRVLADHVLETRSRKFVGNVSARLTRIPENCHPDYWDFRLELQLTRKRKASK